MRYLILILFSLNIFASQELETFKQANTYYQNGDYNKALEGYQTILDNGYESSELYFNLGNTYYKLDLIGKSILNYERAKKLDPSNEDIVFNLKIVELRTVDKIDEIPQFFLKEIGANLINSLSSDTWSILSILSFSFASLMLILFLFSSSSTFKKTSFLVATISVLIGLFTIISASNRATIEIEGNKAVIMNATAYVKSSPSEESTDLFILHEGTRCIIEDSVGEWFKVKIADGNVGWVSQSAIERV